MEHAILQPVLGYFVSPETRVGFVYVQLVGRMWLYFSLTNSLIWLFVPGNKYRVSGLFPESALDTVVQGTL